MIGMSRGRSLIQRALQKIRNVRHGYEKQFCVYLPAVPIFDGNLILNPARRGPVPHRVHQVAHLLRELGIYPASFPLLMLDNLHKISKSHPVS